VERNNQQPKARDFLLVFGKTGMGKSYYANERLYSYDRVIILDPMGEYEGEYCSTLEDIHERICANPKMFRITTDCLADFERLCVYVYTLKNCMFAIEEAQRVLPAGNTPLPPAFLDLIFRGRHHAVSLMIVSQRASTVSIQARSQWSEIIAFRQTEPTDIRYLYNQSGDDDLNNIPKLMPYHFYHITPRETRLKTPVK
jgi:hypothetical protein